MGSLFDRPSVLIIALIAIIVIFGSKRLPDAARGVGRSLRILKAETKGLMTDDEGQAVSQQQVAAPPVAQPVAPAPVPPPTTGPAPAAGPAPAPATGVDPSAQAPPAPPVAQPAPAPEAEQRPS